MKKKESKTREPKAQKFTGFMLWVPRPDHPGDHDLPADRYEIQRAVLRDDAELAIDFNANDPTDDPHVYTIIVTRSDVLTFRGNWSVGKGDDRNSGSCGCRLYSNGKRIAFIGVWKQDGSAQDWVGELIPTEKFEDEV